MGIFFLLVELLSYAFATFLFIKKKELAIIYIPVLNFSNVIIDQVLPKFVYTAVVTGLIFYAIYKNQSFYRKNIFSIILVFYFLVLLTQSIGAPEIKWPHIFSVLWLFLIIPLISAVYQKYTRDVIFKELTNAAFILLILFIANTLVSTKFKFSPNEMYHITSGILYGNLYAAGFNSLAIALFIVLLRIVNERNIGYILVFVVSFLFVMLSLRRSVMGLSLFGVVVAAFALVTQAKVKMLIFFGFIIVVMGVIFLNSSFMDQFQERVELRQLDDRSLDEEKRFFEYDLLYTDMFVYKRYSPWFGFELFNSSGNYGGGVFAERSLHGDIPSVAHSSGIIGVLLYISMVITAFGRAFRAAKTNFDKLVIGFGALAYFTYTGTGRLTELSSLLLIILVISLPLCKEDIHDDHLLAEINSSETKDLVVS